jgi:SAM-dependent methyltransferase
MSLVNDEYNHENPYGLDVDSDFHKTRRNTTISLIGEYTKGRPGVRILDAGCGKGIITKLIHNNFPDSSLDAIDISTNAIEQAIIEEKGINFQKEDALTFKGFGYLYDIIIINNVYEHVENPSGMLINLKQLLADDGVFIISTPNRYHIKNVLRKLFGLRIVIPQYHITEYSIGQIYDHHAYAGLKIKRIIMPDFKRDRLKIRDLVIFNIIQPVLDTYLKLLKSDTRLGCLLFIISGK